MENNSEKKKYLKTLIGDNIYFSPISLDDIGTLKEQFIISTRRREKID